MFAPASYSDECCDLYLLPAGIDASLAKYITLVNSDAFVARGSLFAMWSTFKQQHDVGIVGPMMIGQKSILAEAGGVVMSDGSPANFGRGYSYRNSLVSCICSRPNRASEPHCCINPCGP